MENEIKVGEYIRTKDGFIDKIVDIRDTYSERKLIAFERSNSLKSDIGLKAMVVKHSPNLIDLIQCGDYVNGHLVIDIPGDESGAVYLEQITKGALIPTLKEDIQTIVTKEMMESISYKVKE